MGRIHAIVLATLLLASNPFAFKGGAALDASIGTMVPQNDFVDFNFDCAGHVWYKFDQMVFLGIGSGLQMTGEDRHVPLLASLWLRLPFGGRTLPIAIGDIGYELVDDPQFVWRASGGLDIKNGDRTSLLLLAGYEHFSKLGGFYFLRAGILLEL